MTGTCRRKSEDKAITVFWGILLVLLCVSLAGLVVVRRLVPLPIREAANNVTGIIYGATYVLYVITLAISLYLATYQFQAPFAGSVRVEPEAFEEVLEDIQRHQRAH
jgi:hypothetical protein